MLPRHQISESQRGTAESLIEPDAAIMQGYFGGQADLKAVEGVGAFAIETEDLLEAAIDGLDDVTDAGQPPPPGPRPGVAAVALGRTDHPRAIGILPVALASLTGKALVRDLRPSGRGADRGQARIGVRSQGKERLGQGLVLGAGRTEAEAGDRPEGIDRQPHVEALVPAPAVPPTDIGQPGQPTRPAAFGIARDGRRPVQRFIGTLRRIQEFYQIKKTGHHRLGVPAHQTIKLRPVRQAGKGAAQMASGIAGEIAFPAEVAPLPEQRQSHHFAAAQRCTRAGVTLAARMLLAKVVHHNV